MESRTVPPGTAGAEAQGRPAGAPTPQREPAGAPERRASEPDHDRPVGVTPRDRVRWGPVWAGLVTALTSLVILATLGLAIGVEAFGTGGELLDNDGAALAWGIGSAVVAFLLGGFVAGRSAALAGPSNAAFNGAMVGILAVAAIVVLAGMGVGNVLGALGSNLGAISDLGAAVEAADAPNSNRVQNALETASDAAWTTFATFVIAIAVAAVGGVLGTHRGEKLEERPY